MSKPTDMPSERRAVIRVMLGAAWAALVAFVGLGLGAVMRLVGSSSGPARPSSVAFGAPPREGFGLLTQREGLALMRDAGGLYVLDLTCPHLGCRPAWQAADQGFLCPCHGSRFNATGGLLHGPAQQGLAHLALEQDSSGKLVARLDRKVDPATRLRAG